MSKDDHRIDHFIEMMSAERNAADNTLAAYRRDLASLADFLAHKDRNLDSADGKMIHHWLGGHLSPATQARRLAAVRQFYKFLVLENIRQDNPCDGLDAPHRAQRLPKTLSEAEVDQLLNFIHHMPSETQKELYKKTRLVCMIEILYATGLRVSELVGLALDAVGEERRFLLVRGKGRKERIVPLSQKARDALALWLCGAPRRRSRAAKRVAFSIRPGASHASSVCTIIKAMRVWCGAGRLKKSALMFCATLLPAICSRMARLCALCSKCSAMRIFQPRRSIPM